MVMTATSMDAGANVLAARSLTKFMAISLPPTNSPQLSTPYDAVALLSHAILVAVGFRLVGLGEDDRIESTTSETAESGGRDDTAPHPLPDNWKDQSPNFAFRYKHVQSSMEYLLRVSRMGTKAIIMGMAMGADKTTTFEVKVDDYISASSLPLANDTSSPGTSDDDTRAQAIRDVFISEGRIADYGANMRINIVQKLLPSLQKEGYQEDVPTGATGSASQTQGQQPRRQPNNPDRVPEPYNPYPQDPLLARPRHQAPTGEFLPPGFEDPYDLQRPPRPLGGVGGVPGFGNIGHNDLYPPGMGPNDPLRAPGLGGLRPGGTGGGMHPSFDDPIFQGQGRGGRGGLPGADSGYDIQAPPGARYDPVGPGGAPRGNGGRRPGGFGMGGPPNPFDSFGGNDFI